MGSRRRREPGPQPHAEGQHGRKTHGRFVEMLQQREVSATPTAPAASREGNLRLHQDREQHDEAEKNSEKVEAMREIQRGKVDENVLAHARIPHESDSR